MSEIIKARLRVKKIEMAEPIKAKADLDTAEWEEMPLTLRDDEILIDQAEPEEDAVYSHEEDAPVEVDYTGQVVVVTGSFIRANRTQIAEMLGGAVVGEKYEHSTSLLKLEKAIKFTFSDNSEAVIPNASGFVRLNLGLGKSGVAKFPFKFNCLKASPTWDADIIF